MHLCVRTPNRKHRNAIQAVYPMKYSMLVKCAKCGYENFPQHRFCGMCAAELPFPTAPPAQAARAAQPAPPRLASPPSPVKFEKEPTARNLSYLLEDEPPPSHSARYVWLLVVLVVGAAAAWHWREDLSSVVNRISGGAATGIQQPSAPAPAASSSPTDGPAATASTDVPAEKPATPPDAPSSPPQAQTPVPSPNDQPVPSSAAPSGDVQTGTPSAVAEQPPATAGSSAPTRTSRAPASPTIDEIEAEGEKYLYGNGGPENCARARKNLLAAAQHSNAKAQSVLGTMYATGHCATRDLPTAYRWFGRSLRQDPGNSRIEQDLKVLWNQMTPEERQIALRDNH